MISPQYTTYLILGSNLGDRQAHLANARRALLKLGNIDKMTHLYLTKSWGDGDQRHPHHLNQVLQFRTTKSADELMTEILDIELGLGRVRNADWQPRIIDIDILFFDQQIHSSPFLTIPHCRISERNFVLVPLMEIAADFRHPTLLKTIEELYLSCEDNLEVLMLEDHG